MLNTKIFYDNAKYFATGGYYFWAIFGPTYDSSASASATVNDFDASKLIDGTASLKNLAAISTPIAVATTSNSVTTYNASVKYTTTDSSGSSTDVLLNDGGKTTDAATSLTYTFPSASSGLLVNESTVTSGVGVAGDVIVALYWASNVDSNTGVKGLGLIVDENGTVVTTGYNFDTAKVKWNYVDANGSAADLFTGIGSNVNVNTLAGCAGKRGTNFELIYYTNTTIGTGTTSVLNSYNYTGFTVGSLTVTLATS